MHRSVYPQEAVAAPLRPRRARALQFGVALCTLVLLAACGKSDEGGAQGARQMPPAQVGVIRATTQAVPLRTELPGRVEALRTAEVRARVNGVVLKRLFAEGSDVKAGQPLFTIDAAPYRASVDSAQAALARSQANLAQAGATVERYRPLAAANAISRQDWVNAQAAQQAALAEVEAGRAALRSARINLDYASVTAPIGGRIGRALVTEGALVSATSATPLATIQQIGSVYVNFTQSVIEVQKLRQGMADGKLRRAGANAAEVQVLLEDGSVHAHAGRLLFSDLAVDATSGQVTLRAEVPNPEGWLLPGQYVRVRITQGELPAAMLIPQQAVTRSAQADTVLVVGADNKPASRPVKIAGQHGDAWIVTGGLQEGEQVIVDGFQKMMVAGMPVQPVPWQRAASAAGAAASAPGAPASAARAAAAPASTPAAAAASSPAAAASR